MNKKIEFEVKDKELVKFEKRVEGLKNLIKDLNSQIEINEWFLDCAQKRVEELKGGIISDENTKRKKNRTAC